MSDAASSVAILIIKSVASWFELANLLVLSTNTLAAAGPDIWVYKHLKHMYGALIDADPLVVHQLHASA